MLSDPASLYERLVVAGRSLTFYDTKPDDATRIEQPLLLTLDDADGVPHRLGDLWVDRPVILVFLRHFG